LELRYALLVQPVTSALVLTGTGRAAGARRAALGSGIGALVLMGVVGGCTTVTGGHSTANGADVPVYRSSVTASVSASVSRSAARESERRESQTVEAIHAACETMSTTSADAIDAVNAYVDAMNGDAAEDPAAAEAPAADALNQSADEVAANLDGALPQEVRDALRAWIDAAHQAATTVPEHQSPEQFNVAIRRLNDTRSDALNLCDAHY